MAAVPTEASAGPTTVAHNNTANDVEDCGMDFSKDEPKVKPKTHEMEAFRSEVVIARVEFERVQGILIVALFIMIVVIAKMGWFIVYYIAMTRVMDAVHLDR